MTSIIFPKFLIAFLFIFLIKHFVPDGNITSSSPYTSVKASIKTAFLAMYQELVFSKFKLISNKKSIANLKATFLFLEVESISLKVIS